MSEGWQPITLKQGHEGDCKGLQPLVEGFQRAFTADGIAEEDREKVDHLVVPEAPPCKTHALTELGQDALLAQMLDDEHHLAKPRGCRGNGVRKGLDDHRRIDDTVHICLLCEESFHSSSSRRHIFLLTRYWLHLVAQFVGHSLRQQN